MSSAAAHQLKDVLTSKGVTSLESFHYFNNMSGDEGAKAIAEIVQKSPDLTDLRFSGTRAGRAGSLVFAEALRARQLLVTVDLADNRLRPRAGQLLGEWLSAANGASPLEVLNVRDCSLGDDGFSDPVRGRREKCDNPPRFGLLGQRTDGGRVYFHKMALFLCFDSKDAVLQLEENEFSRGAGALAKGFLHHSSPLIRAVRLPRVAASARAALSLWRRRRRWYSVAEEFDQDGKFTFIWTTLYVAESSLLVVLPMRARSSRTMC